jgi:hypothetical protein
MREGGGVSCFFTPMGKGWARMSSIFHVRWRSEFFSTGKVSGCGLGERRVGLSYLDYYGFLILNFRIFQFAVVSRCEEWVHAIKLID